jgi:Preprotein translocase subunit SecD
MTIYYRIFGLFSSAALAINGFFLIALLSMIQATLTLPAWPPSHSRSAWPSMPTC